MPTISNSSRLILAAAIIFSVALTAAAQQPGGPDAQRAAMQKLAFLAGHWSGPVTIVRGPGEPLQLTQTENIQFKLDGLVLLVEGQSTDKDGKVSFSALATIAFDEATHTYRIRAYHDGHYVDAELVPTANGFSWSFDSGPAHVANTMRLTGKNEWSETTDVTVGSNPPMHSVDMLLAHQP
jgi:hypothetical protein